MHIPQPGQKITVALPNETVLATVDRIVNDDTLVVSLNCGLVISKTHGHKMGDTIGAIRQTDALGQETWQGVDPEALERMTRKGRKRRG